MLLTRSPLSYIRVRPKTSANITPFDLHVLGAPPAFVLSHLSIQNAIACVLNYLKEMFFVALFRAL